MRVLAEGRAFFAARLRGKRRVFSDISLATMGLRYPLMPQAVLSLIHLQALKLWTLGLQYRRPPEVVR
jgi:DUF1365 family protein